MTWVKASERLPLVKGVYFVRDLTDGRKIVWHFNSGCCPNNLLVRFRWKMEWLDETEIKEN
jgi:hypothetical protein